MLLLITETNTFMLSDNLDQHVTSILSDYFTNKISNISGCNYKFNISKGYSRCLARVWDINNPVMPNINKRCKHVTLEGFNVCKTHLKHNKHGMVNEYPPEHVVRLYSSKNKNSLNSINLKHKLIIIENNSTNKHLKKNVTYKSKQMSLESINYEKEILEYKAIHNNLDNDLIYNQIIKNNEIKHITISEKELIISNLLKYSNSLGNSHSNTKKKKLKIIKKKKKHNSTTEIGPELNSSNEHTSISKSSNKHDTKNFNIDKCECIKIIDNNHMTADVYLNPNNSNIYNESKVLIGSHRIWIDEEGEIPDSFKNADGIVLHPKTRLPLYDYMLHAAVGVFCDIEPGTYREYEYDEDFEAFKISNQVLRAE